MGRLDKGVADTTAFDSAGLPTAHCPLLTVVCTLSVHGLKDPATAITTAASAGLEAVDAATDALCAAIVVGQTHRICSGHPR